MISDKCPCMGCINVGCGSYHDKCPEYQDYRKKLEEDYSERRKRLQLRHDLNYLDHVHLMRNRKKRIGFWK